MVKHFTERKDILEFLQNNPYWLAGFASFSTYSPSLYKMNVATNNTDLVIWGTNLCSTVGTRFSRTQLSMVMLPFHIQGIMVGLILSDAWVSKTYKNAYLGFSQSMDHFQ